MTFATLKLSSHCRGSGDVEARPRRRVSERRGSATLSRRRHCALSGAGLASSCGRGEGGETRSRERAERGHTAALRPAREEQPRRSAPRAGARRERAGGRPRGEGSRGRRNGCHVARWVSAPAPAEGRDLCHTAPLPAGLVPGESAHGGAPARRPQPTGAGTSPALFREVSPGPGGAAQPETRGPEGSLSLPEACGASFVPSGSGEGGRGSPSR